MVKVRQYVCTVSICLYFHMFHIPSNWDMSSILDSLSPILYYYSHSGLYPFRTAYLLRHPEAYQEIPQENRNWEVCSLQTRRTGKYTEISRENRPREFSSSDHSAMHIAFCVPPRHRPVLTEKSSLQGGAFNLERTVPFFRKVNSAYISLARANLFLLQEGVHGNRSSLHITFSVSKNERYPSFFPFLLPLWLTGRWWEGEQCL